MRAPAVAPRGVKFRLDPATVIRGPIHLILLALGTQAVAETDIWGHIRFGLDLIATRTLPSVDHYSFTTTQHWVNHEWLSQALLALAFARGGVPLLALLRAGSLIATLIIVDRGLRGVAWPLRDAFMCALVLIALPMLAMVRPQIFSFPLYALTLTALSRDAPWLPAVFAIWANLHGGWLIGLGAVAVRTVCAPTKRRALVLAACAAATLLTPFGFGLWVSLIEAMTRGWADVLEWQPIWVPSNGLHYTVAWCLLVMAAVWVAYKKLPVQGWEWMWTICVGVAAARARRHVPFFALTVILLLLSRLRVRSVDLSNTKWTPQAAALLAIPAVAACFVAVTMLRPNLSCLPALDRPVRPEASAVRFIRTADIRGRVLMWFDWGLYAVWHVGDRIQVSIDNRRETVYSAQTVADHRQFYFGGAPDYADRIGADYVWLPASLPAVGQLASRGWHIAFRGPYSVILGREDRLLVVGDSEPTQSCFPDP